MKEPALRLAIAALTIFTIIGCNKERSNIEGNWEIDLTPMLQQARSMGTSNAEVEQVREIFRDGKLAIDSNRITLTIAGMQGSEVFDYKIDSKDGQCLNLIINSSTHRYCTFEGRLEVHDPSTKLVAVYRKI